VLLGVKRHAREDNGYMSLLPCNRLLGHLSINSNACRRHELQDG
jgi:hypothetical protein